MTPHRADTDIATVPEEGLADFARWLIYGLGRGSGIRVTPRRHAGSVREQVVALIVDVEAAEKQPSDHELGSSVSESAQSLAAARQTDDARTLVLRLRGYVTERLAARNGITEV
jgi:hypothetical protein